MVCPNCYAELPCHLSGVGYTFTTAEVGSQVLRLQKNHAMHFPKLNDCQYFFVYLTDACNKRCAQARVIGVDYTADALYLDSPLPMCLSSLSRVSYDVGSVAAIRSIAAEIGINAISPLVYDCATRTLSIDCQAMRDLLDNCKESYDA